MSSGITKDATVNISAKVDPDIATAAERIFSPLERATQNVQTRLGSIASTTALTFANVAMDIARVSTALGAIDLASAANRYVRYREEVARTAAVAGTEWERLATKYKTVGDNVATSDESVSKFARNLQQTTFDASDSSQAIEALGQEALNTNRSLDQMAGLGEAVHNEFGAQFEDIPAMLARIRTTADTLGTTGGPAALEAQLASLAGSISKFSLKTDADIAAAVSSVGELGKGLSPTQQARVQQRVIGRLESDTEGLRRQLGILYEEFYDERGKIRDNFGDLIQKVQQAAAKRWGLRAREVLSQPQNFGDAETAAAVMAFDNAEARTSATTPLTKEAAEKARTFLDSDIGRDIVKRLRIERNKRDEGGGPLADIQAATGEWMSEHPFLTLFGGQAAWRLGSQALGWAFKGTAAGEGALGAVGAASPAGQLVTGGLGWLGGTVAGSLAAGTGLAALTYFALDKMGLGKFNDSIEPFRKQLEAQGNATREGRVYAIVRAAERADEGGFTPERYRQELGPRLMGEIARDPALQAVASGAASGVVPHGLDQQAPQLAAALRDALKDVKFNVQLQLQDDTGSPHRVVVANRGARQ
jgi:hypothetical protein